MKKLILFVTAILLTSLVSLNAQYNIALGLRAGGTSGITLKKITTNYTAVEGIVGFWNDGLSITGLYEKHPGAPGNFHWIFGAGAHLTFYEDNLRGDSFPAWYADHPGDIEDGALGFGIDAVGGLEFFFEKIPLAISFELKPFIEFTTSENIWLSLDPGFGIKLAF